MKFKPLNLNKADMRTVFSAAVLRVQDESEIFAARTNDPKKVQEFVLSSVQAYRTFAAGISPKSYR
jgi:hypothetical protein